MPTFTKRGFGRIYTTRPEDVPKVKAIIKEIDEDEARYMPEDLITSFDNYPALVYMHKFSDMNLNDLMARCFACGLPIFCLDAGFQEYIASATVPPVNP